MHTPIKNLKKQTEGLSKKDKGFTIIEVMIVLVIAAVIILIVFLAVPALQRNSRNNQRKSHASRLLAAANEYRSNNTNNYPSAATDITALAGTSGFYSSGNVIWVPANSLTSDATITAEASPIFIRANVYVLGGTQCKTNGTVIGPGNGISALYYVETSGGNVQGQCI